MENTGLKLFISYAHKDNNHIEEFKKHITPLKDNGSILEWNDKKITAGKDFQKEINNNLENSDIICLFISANFLVSENCKKERDKAFELKNKKGVYVVPIIPIEPLPMFGLFSINIKAVWVSQGH